MDIDNDVALESVLMNEINAVIDECSNEALEEIQKSIQDIVYDAHTPRVYERLGYDGGFIGSWIKEKLQEGAREATFSIYSDPMLMESDYPHHQSIDGEDRTSMMVENILKGINWDWNYPDGSDEWWKEPRDFWTPALQAIESKFFTSFLSKLQARLGWNIM